MVAVDDEVVTVEVVVVVVVVVVVAALVAIVLLLSAVLFLVVAVAKVWADDLARAAETPFSCMDCRPGWLLLWAWLGGGRVRLTDVDDDDFCW